MVGQMTNDVDALRAASQRVGQKTNDKGQLIINYGKAHYLQRKRPSRFRARH